MFCPPSQSSIRYAICSQLLNYLPKNPFYLTQDLTLAINVVEMLVILFGSLAPLREALALSTTTTYLHGHEAMLITPTYLAGFTLLVLGTILRVTCYRTLGKFFTFELTLRPGHSLVTTGPYAFVRHPSYTAGFMFMTALLICQLGEGSWWRQSGWWGTWVERVFFFGWVGTVGIVESILVWRTTKEDEVLRAEFGKTWETWARKTQYRIIPFVF